MLRAQSGDLEALNELLKTIQKPLYRYISTLAREQAPAEDILQEVFIRIYRKLGWLREPQVHRFENRTQRRERRVAAGGKRPVNLGLIDVGLCGNAPQVWRALEIRKNGALHHF